MNETFNKQDPEHRNLISKLNNTVVDLNFYCYRFLIRYGFRSTQKTALFDATALVNEKCLPVQVFEILAQYRKIKNATPETANDLFYSTWIFLHDFDKQLKSNG